MYRQKSVDMGLELGKRYKRMVVTFISVFLFDQRDFGSVGHMNENISSFEFEENVGR